MSEIIKRLKEMDDLYYNSGTSPASDAEYDEMKEVAKEAFPDDPYFDVIGSTIPGEKVKLPYVLGSLDKIKPDTLEKWVKKNPGPYVTSTKLDGVSIMVEYRNGEVFFATTRGDGYEGRDITDKAKIFCKPIFDKDRIVLRGEAVMIGDSYITMGFKNRRNGVAGILNKDNGPFCKHITPVFYEVLNRDSILYFDGDRGNVYDEFLFISEQLGLETPLFLYMNSIPTSFLIQTIKTEIEFKDYDIDGLVIAINESKRENVLKPKRKIAFKVPGESIQTEVLDIEWSVTRQGRIIPVVILNPTNIGGVTVQRATGFNATFIRDNKIGKGSIVSIVRSGDVIPYITGVVTPCDNFRIPSRCPSCDELLTQKGVDSVCVNRTCGESMYYKVEHFLRTLGVENITHKTLIKLGLNTIESCYNVDEFEIAGIEGFGYKRAEQIVEEIEKSLTTTPEALLASLGIPGVSMSTSKAVMKHIGEFVRLFTITKAELEEIEGIGPITAKNIFDNINRIHDIFSFLVGEGLVFEEVENSDKLLGKKFTLTGKGPMGRGPLQKMIEAKGGLVKGIGKTIDFLVTSDMESQTGKAKKAREYGVAIISYEDLLELLK
jgi:DNA ligase (NAD+)